MARPEKPTAQHKRDGTYREDRHGRRIDANFKQSPLPEPPTELKKYSREMWDEVCGNLPEDVLVRLDRYQLMGMCEWWQQWRELQNAIDTCSDVLDPTYFKLNQMCAIVWKHFAAAASRFGMTPTDRAKLKVVEKEKDDGDPLTLLKMQTRKAQ